MDQNSTALLQYQMNLSSAQKPNGDKNNNLTSTAKNYKKNSRSTQREKYSKDQVTIKEKQDTNQMEQMKLLSTIILLWIQQQLVLVPNTWIGCCTN